MQSRLARATVAPATFAAIAPGTFINSRAGDFFEQLRYRDIHLRPFSVFSAMSVRVLIFISYLDKDFLKMGTHRNVLFYFFALPSFSVPCKSS